MNPHESAKKIENKTEASSNKQLPTETTFCDTKKIISKLNPVLNKLSSRDRSFVSAMYSQPLATTKTSFNHVANYLKNPHELINHIGGVRHANGRQAKSSSYHQRTNENLAKVLNGSNHNGHSFKPASPPSIQEMDIFASASTHDQPSQTTYRLPERYKNGVVGDDEDTDDDGDEEEEEDDDDDDDDDDDEKEENSEEEEKGEDKTSNNCKASPNLSSTTNGHSKKRVRIEPLNIDEYESEFRESATDLQLIERVFQGSMSCNQLRAALWPYLFGLTTHRDRFERYETINGTTKKISYLYKEHKANTSRWEELEKLYHLYEAQWKAITPDQETRFATFRERRSTIERDVIRCDRLHPFYAQNNENLDTLNKILMTYMMYDFDIGYVQGMSDLAAPILYMNDGNLVKSFWIFVEAMKLFRRNFVPNNVDFQLSCLFKLIEETDPTFAQYLEKHESSNCFFAFRPIVCQFKRELMKTDEDDYSNVLLLWDTIWSVKRRFLLQEERELLNGNKENGLEINGATQINNSISTKGKLCNGSAKTISKPAKINGTSFHLQCDPDESESSKNSLRETEIFILALCLSMIKRERNKILANQLDGTDIHQHFSNPELANDLNGFIADAINIYSKTKRDLDIKRLITSKKEPILSLEVESPFGSAESYVVIRNDVPGL